MFIQDSEVKSYVQAQLHLRNLNEMPTYWDELVPIAHTKAYNEILRAILQRGFTIAQILAWTAGPEYEYDLSAWWLIKTAGQLANYDDKFIASLDRRNELKTCTILNIVQGLPVLQASNQIGFGTADSSTQQFYRDITGDHGKGCDKHQTKW